MPKTLKDQLLLDRCCRMVHELNEEPEKDIIVITFDNAEDIELEPQQKKKKSDFPKTKKIKLSETKYESILYLSKQER